MRIIGSIFVVVLWLVIGTFSQLPTALSPLTSNNDILFIEISYYIIHKTNNTYITFFILWRYFFIQIFIIFSLSPSDVMVRLGENNMNSKNASPSRRDIRVSAIIIHEDYDKKTKLNDIAILQLEERIGNWTNMIRPISLPTKAHSNLEGRKATVAGIPCTFYLKKIKIYNFNVYFLMLQNRMGV